MADLTCHKCGRELDPAAVLCPRCRSPRHRQRPGLSVSADDVESEPAHVGNGDALRTPSLPEVEARHSPGGPGDKLRAPERSSTPRLELPWGPVPVAGRLAIGRDPDFSPLAYELEQGGHLSVSRRHAEVYQDAGLLVVRDVGSTFGTYVNGDEVPQGRDTPLQEGDQLRFGQVVVARVQT